MDGQTTIFDALEAQRRRDVALVIVADNADERWMTAASWALRWTAVQTPELTTDDVWSTLHEFAIPAPVEPRALGAVMKLAAGAGLISATDRIRPSARPEAHSRPCRVWRSEIHR
jgi:hypothetical protein